MIEIIKELNIEVSKPNVFQAVVAKQYDMNTRFIKATFVDFGEKITIPQSATLSVIINALRPDGESKGFDGVINDDGTVTVPLHSWMLELVGTVTCDISVIDMAHDNNKKLTTTSFTLLVEKAAWGGDGITSDPQYDVMVELLERCVAASELAEDALQKSTEANSKYDACVEATEAANRATEELSMTHDDIVSGGHIEALKEKNNGTKVSVWVGSEEEYNSLTKKENNCLYLTEEEKDYIVEQGTCSVGIPPQTWEYRKWDSGYAECWGEVIFNLNYDVQAGGGIECPVNFPFDFVGNSFKVLHSAANSYKIRKTYPLDKDGDDPRKVFTVYIRLEDSEHCNLPAGEYISVCCLVKGKWK